MSSGAPLHPGEPCLQSSVALAVSISTVAAMCRGVHVAVAAHARARLEHVCYLLRPPLALERLRESSGGLVLYELAHPRADGATHLLLDPLELLEKLSVVIPTIPSDCTT